MKTVEIFILKYKIKKRKRKRAEAQREKRERKHIIDYISSIFDLFIMITFASINRETKSDKRETLN
jgi:hypothetical protein